MFSRQELEKMEEQSIAGMKDTIPT